MNWKFTRNVVEKILRDMADWNQICFHCFQIQNVFAVCNLKKHSIKCSLISSKGMYGWPLYIQKTEWCVNPDMWSPSKCFPLLPLLLYHCLESYRKNSFTKRPSESEVVAWAHSKQCLTRYCLNSYPLFLSYRGTTQQTTDPLIHN